MGRIVQLDTGWQTVSAVQDLQEIKLAATQAGFINSVIISQSSEEGITDNEVLQVNCKRASGSFNSGSGGSALTVFLTQSIASAVHGLTTIERNNTTQATVGSGVLELIPVMGGGFNVNSGEWERTPTPELRQPIGPSEAFIVSLDEAPADAITMRCIVVLDLTHG